MNEPRATCALHFDAPAAATCSRCGRFSCVTCLASTEPPLCAACAPAVMDPFDIARRSLEVTHALKASLRITWAELPKLMGLAFVFSMPAAALQVALVHEGDDLKTIAASMRVSAVFDFFIGVLCVQAMMALFIARAEGRALSLAGAMRMSSARRAPAVGAQLRSSLWVGFALLLLVVPGVWKATTLMFVSVAVMRVPRRDALAVSEALVTGQFARCFGFGTVLLAIFFVPYFIGSNLLGIALGELGAPRFALEFLNGFFNRLIIEGAMGSALLVGFVMLHRSAGHELPTMQWLETPPLQPSGQTTS